MTIRLFFLYVAYQESAEERWRPILSVESIIISVISMLSNPNDESPANLDAAVSSYYWFQIYSRIISDDVFFV